MDLSSIPLIGDADPLGFGLKVIIVLLVFYITIKTISKRAAPEERPRFRRTLYTSASKSGQVTTAQVETEEEVEEDKPTVEIENNEDDTMAKKTLSVVYECGEECAADCYDTKQEAIDCCDNKKPIKKYCCSECESVYDTIKEANDTDDCAGKFQTETESSETLHFIDGVFQYGHMECCESGCSWKGSLDETSVDCISNAKTAGGPAGVGGSLYTGTSTNDAGFEDVTGSELVYVRLCPTCQSNKIVFKPKV